MFHSTEAFSRREQCNAGRRLVEETGHSKHAQRGARRSAAGTTTGLRLRSNVRSQPRAGMARLLILLLVALAAPRADAQVLYGTRTGNVTDPAGAVVAGAKVEALNVNTGIAKETTTDDAGRYVFSDLQPGVYKVTVTASSFKVLAQENVRIDANMVRRLDGQLQTSGVSETILITASSVAIQSDRADINLTQS